MSGDADGVWPSPTPQRLFGVYVAVVTDHQDPDGQGRVRIRLPWIDADDGGSATSWARLSTLMAGGGRGSWFVPEIDDEVLVSFMQGDPRWPVVIGSLWNGRDQPPQSMDSGNNLRSITSRSGHVLTFDDTAGSELVRIETQGGHRLTLDDASGGTITLAHSGGATITMDAAGKVAIDTSGQVTITAGSTVDITASMVNVNAGLSKFSGVVQADTVITNAVVSSSYTPGAGNVW